MRLQLEQLELALRDVSRLVLEIRSIVNKPVIMPAPALSLVLIGSGVAIGFESPPLPALKRLVSHDASVSENHYLLGVAL